MRPRHLPAPEIDVPGLTWINVETPLSLTELRGRIVLLDFWTSCCINCIHILSTLTRVEEMYPTEVVVVGVHSPKFVAERAVAAVTSAVARYGIHHPVVHDPDFTLWTQYGIQAWPTLVFIGPDGGILGMTSGEPDPTWLLSVLGQLVLRAQEAGLLVPLAPASVSQQVSPGRLRFPTAMRPLPRASGEQHWALTDSGNNQIVILSREGDELMRVGSGTAGMQDGSLAQAQFQRPQGLVCAEDTIFIADTENHAIRRVRLAHGSVSTLAGTGSRGAPLRGVAAASTTALASPMDLQLNGSCLYIANAGTHQLGTLHLDRQTLALLAGDAREGIEDGPAVSARLAQPSGLALDEANNVLYFVDSETSSVRVIDGLRDSPRVRTLAGTGLFDFGHRNGPLTEAQFQHPSGLALAGTHLMVADTYNAALREIDLPRATVCDPASSFLCEDAVCVPLSYPTGVAIDNPRRVLLVDTNNHRVLAFDFQMQSYRTWLR